MILAIHQPNFFPWYPFFNKLANSDVFVILTHCQYEKGGFQNRFNLNNTWFTMSVEKRIEPIAVKKYIKPQENWRSIVDKLPIQYRAIAREFDDCIHESLVRTNVEIIRRIADILKIKTEIVVDEPTKATSTQRLIEICKHYGAKSYLAGSSGKNYMDMSLFDSARIDVQEQCVDNEMKLPILEYLCRDVSTVS